VVLYLRTDFGAKNEKVSKICFPLMEIKTVIWKKTWNEFLIKTLFQELTSDKNMYEGNNRQISDIIRIEHFLTIDMTKRA
jgi:hypothetical protein